MQRRLFVFFILFSMIPALVILAINWQVSQRNLDYLDSPGLQSSLESSLQLAQERLAAELALVAVEAVELSEAIARTGGWPEPPAGAGYLFSPPNGSRRIVGQLSVDFFDEVQRRYPANQIVPTRLQIEPGDWLLAAAETAAGRLVLARPLDVDLARQLDAVVQGSSRFRQLHLYYSDLLRTSTVVTLIIITVVILAISLILSRWLARQIAGPVRALAQGTEQIAAGNLEVQIDVVAPDELGDLVTAFNRMARDLKQGKEDLLRAERVAAWQGIARRLAHEIKNPLTPISLAMHRIEKRGGDPAVRDSIASVLEEVNNLKLLADEFSQYARLPEPNYENVDLRDILQAVTELYVDAERVTVHWDPADDREPWWVRADAGQIRQVTANLVKNAVQAMAGRGALSYRLARSADTVTATVTDTGSGLPEPADQVFEPYFTTRSTGTGLGLAIARKIVEDHGGSLVASNVESGGAAIRLTLPAAEQESS
jgi:nitrogen fixation/metabolism regulation signal transduction histidine kinase